MDLADYYANQYGACYTPSKKSSCKLKDGKWTCMAPAHNHRGSCGKDELSRFGERERRYSGSIPIIIFGQKKINHIPEDELNDENYTDALPEDYIL